MDKIRVVGGRPLEGTVRISGAKNASLPDLCAALLTDQPVVLRNVPEVRDIRTMGRVLSALGAEVELPGGRRGGGQGARPDLGGGPLRAREDHAGLGAGARARCWPARAARGSPCPAAARSAPGPSTCTSRPSRRWAPRIAVEHGYVEAQAERLRGAEIYFDTVTVTGTENVMMAASLAEGETVLRNAACEPEVVDLADLLVNMGAQIQGAGGPVIRIEGVDRLHGADHTVIPDRIETGTFVAACAIAGGDIEIRACQPAAPAGGGREVPRDRACASRKGPTTCACARRGCSRPRT